jgi:PAS domain S-box-containing protein
VQVCDDAEIVRLQAELEELREARATLITAQRIAHFGSWEWDTRSGEVKWSDEVYRIFGLDPETFQPQIDSILALSPPEEQGRGQELIDRCIANRRGGSYEQRFYRPDGSLGTYVSTFEPVFDDSDELIGMVGVAHDISERKQAEAERNELEMRYQQAQRMESLGRLAGGVAHDLNNLLTPIIAYGEILVQRKSSEDKAQHYLEEIINAGKRARDLVSQLLAFSRKQTLTVKPIDLNEVITGFQQLLRRTIREDIDITLELAARLPAIRADHGQLEQVLMNLAVNSQDAMPDGGCLTIATRLAAGATEQSEAEGESELVELIVSDTGVGMDAETRAQVFDPFFTSKEQGHGTGLGLATVYGIVSQHGGEIRVDSQPGGGAVFHISFPACRQPIETKASEHFRQTTPGSETVLVVEDNAVVRKMVVTILRGHGYEVMSTADAQSALDIVTNHPGSLHLLLTDVIMPGMNGRQLAGEALRIRPALRVLFMSGYTDDVIAKHGVLDDGIPFIHKPFTVQALISKVQYAMQRPPLDLPEESGKG